MLANNRSGEDRRSIAPIATGAFSAEAALEVFCVYAKLRSLQAGLAGRVAAQSRATHEYFISAGGNAARAAVARIGSRAGFNRRRCMFIFCRAYVSRRARHYGRRRGIDQSGDADRQRCARVNCRGDDDHGADSCGRADRQRASLHATVSPRETLFL